MYKQPYEEKGATVINAGGLMDSINEWIDYLLLILIVICNCTLP